MCKSDLHQGKEIYHLRSCHRLQLMHPQTSLHACSSLVHVSGNYHLFLKARQLPELVLRATTKGIVWGPRGLLA